MRIMYAGLNSSRSMMAKSYLVTFLCKDSCPEPIAPSDRLCVETSNYAEVERMLATWDDNHVAEITISGED